MSASDNLSQILVAIDDNTNYMMASNKAIFTMKKVDAKLLSLIFYFLKILDRKYGEIVIPSITNHDQ